MKAKLKDYFKRDKEHFEILEISGDKFFIEQSKDGLGQYTVGVVGNNCDVIIIEEFTFNEHNFHKPKTGIYAKAEAYWDNFK